MNQFPYPQSQYLNGLQPQPFPTAPTAHDLSNNTPYPMTECGYSTPPHNPNLQNPANMHLTTSHCDSHPKLPVAMLTGTPLNQTQYPYSSNSVSTPFVMSLNQTQYPHSLNPMPQPTMQYGHVPPNIPVSAPSTDPWNGCHYQTPSQYPHDTSPVCTPQPPTSHCQTLPIMPVSLPTKTPWKPGKKTKYRGNDIPSKDVSENAAEVKVANVSPLPYNVKVPGYENVSHSEGSLIMPPVLSEQVVKHSPAIIDSQRFPNITDEDARRALLELAQSNCCWGTKAAKKMDVKDVVGTSAYHYIMESFTEGRRISCAFKPFKGGTIDVPQCGVSPLPWDIHCNPKAVFQNETHEIQVPHTEIVTECHICNGRGFNRCAKCRGRGTLRCGSCDGSKIKIVEDESGNKEEVECGSCTGKGQKNCSKCSGMGCTVCTACKGYRSITQYIKLTVGYSHRSGDHIMERTDLPDHLIRNVNGDVLFEQTSKLVCPIENFYESEINSASQRLVQSHNSSWPAERMLKQKHQLRSVPVHECHFEYKGKSGRFWVYGNQKDVYTCDYPHTCCCCRCCCTIL